MTNVVIEKKTKALVKQHSEVWHEGVFDICYQCNYKFKWKTQLKGHVKM